MANKILLYGYYWPSLHEEAKAHVHICDKCQRYADIPRLPSTEQTAVVATWPFDMWGIDLIGPFPLARGGCKYAIVAVDYFTKWVEAQPLASITEENAIIFVCENI